MPPKKSRNPSKSLIKQSHTLATTINRARSMEARPKMYAKHNKRVEYEKIDNDTVFLSGNIPSRALRIMFFNILLYHFLLDYWLSNV